MKILIAAGGTGGHLFPGIALAEAFKEKDEGTAVLFVGTGRDLDKRTMIPAGCDFEVIDAASVKGKNPLRVLAALLHLGRGIMQALLIIRRFAPQLVLGMGGYEISRGRFATPAWYTAFWYALNIFLKGLQDQEAAEG